MGRPCEPRAQRGSRTLLQSQIALNAIVDRRFAAERALVYTASPQGPHIRVWLTHVYGRYPIRVVKQVADFLSDQLARNPALPPLDDLLSTFTQAHDPQYIIVPSLVEHTGMVSSSEFKQRGRKHMSEVSDDRRAGCIPLGASRSREKGVRSRTRRWAARIAQSACVGGAGRRESFGTHVWAASGGANHPERMCGRRWAARIAQNARVVAF